MKAPHTILVIEDEAPIRDIIYEMLADANFKVLTAENGREGLEIAHQQRPDLILCDIVMPELDGYDVLNHLRSHLPTALTPFIFLTAKADHTQVRRGMILGADDYLIKPFTRVELLEAVQVRLQRQQFIQSLCALPMIPYPTSSQAAVEEEELQLALARREFQLYYQPQINLQTGALFGAEALLRWHSPKRGIVSPGEFIPLAEATGFVVPLGKWVLQTACRQIQAWLGEGLPPLVVSVNLSSAQFNQSDLIDDITQILEETQIPPERLGVELTESLLIKNVEETMHRLKALQALNIHVSIDDFGTGYASLGYLQHFPFNILKIDRCFIRNVEQNRTNAAITNAVIHMAHALNQLVIAEGIETEAERNYLTDQGCDVMQGFLISRPLPLEAFNLFRATYQPGLSLEEADQTQPQS